jgi:hypothetical protein
VLTCERLLSELDSCPGPRLSQQSSDALVPAPGAAAWTRRFTRIIAIAHRAFRQHTAPTMVGCTAFPGRSRITESKLMHRTPVDLCLDEWVYDFFDTRERTQASGVAIDSLGDLKAACRVEIRFREYIYSLL